VESRATAADFVDCMVKNAQFLIMCNYKVEDDGKTNPTKKDDVNRLKTRGELSVFAGGYRRRTSSITQ
jgi:hypothetical protein